MKSAMLQGGTILVAALASTGMLMPQAARSAEPVYSVVSPLGEPTQHMIDMVPRLNSLSNKTVCLVSNHDFKANYTMPVIEKALKERGIKVVPYTDFPGMGSGSRFSALPAAYRAKGCDAVVSGNGG